MKQRVLTALVGIPAVLAIIAVPQLNMLFMLLLVAMVVIGVRESMALTGQKRDWLEPGLALIVFLFGLVLIPVFRAAVSVDNTAFDRSMHSLYLVGLTGFGMLCGVLRQRFSLMALSLFWIVAPALALLSMFAPIGKGIVASWPNPILMVLIPVWGGDSAAMLAGKAFGKHKMAPGVSPNKTWEGSFANLLVSIILCWAVGLYLQVPLTDSLLCGIAVGVFGQLGDLYESLLKRRAEIKDSGSIIPGHGGLLDRIDALLVCAPLVHLILTPYLAELSRR